MRLLVTGGAGFLGSHFVRDRVVAHGDTVTNVDLLTYAGSAARLRDVEGNERYRFARGDVGDRGAVAALMEEARPEVVVHFAAESHVTRSERAPEVFRRTNVEGTASMLAAAEQAGAGLFVHISTDEVYGPCLDGAFAEEDKAPGPGHATSAYARSKAEADDLARSHDGRMRVVVVRPTNCFGPWQHPEKALPRWITRGLLGKPLLVWGDGLYVRQWLYAGDLAAAIDAVVAAGAPDPVYNVGPRHTPEITNLDMARHVLGLLGLSEDRLVLTAYDRPDHDRRYAIDPSRIEALGWRPGDVWGRVEETVRWYRDNASWWQPLIDAAEEIYEDEPADAT